MATGVLVLGVGNGTKRLGDFLECTKSYEAVMLFGAATDSYDAVGKVIGRRGYGHVTRAMVEEKLGGFRGKIMQRPPIFSALRVQGKRLYEYAREGKEVPVEIQERPVEVRELEMVEWMEGGSHGFHWPAEEAGKEEKVLAEKVLHFGGDGRGGKRKREEEGGEGGEGGLKRSKVTPEPEAAPPTEDEPAPSTQRPSSPTSPPQQPQQPCQAPACRLRMTVTSGFYVRSLCHDLGAAVDSLALMSSLVRTRQGEFSLGGNVLEYGDLEKGEEVWGPRVKEILEGWQGRAGAKMEDSEDGVEDRGVKEGDGDVKVVDRDEKVRSDDDRYAPRKSTKVRSDDDRYAPKKSKAARPPNERRRNSPSSHQREGDGYVVKKEEDVETNGVRIKGEEV